MTGLQFSEPNGTRNFKVDGITGVYYSKMNASLEIVIKVNLLSP